MDKRLVFQHKELAQGRWAKMSFAEQMANIGSEVSRALNWQKKGRENHSESAFHRALELIDLTVPCLVEQKRWPALKELLRVREALVDYFYGENTFGSSEILWRKYFDYFAYIARSPKGPMPQK